jgi:hypothetical protein
MMSSRDIHVVLIVAAWMLFSMLFTWHSVEAADEPSPPPGPYISLHLFPGLADIQSISENTSSSVRFSGQRLSAYPRPSHFNAPNSYKIPAQNHASQASSGQAQQGSWHW